MARGKKMKINQIILPNVHACIVLKCAIHQPNQKTDAVIVINVTLIFFAYITKPLYYILLLKQKHLYTKIKQINA